MENFHTIIIGGGPGGTKAAKILASAKKRVALVSQDLGGECLNYGCIPTKMYLWAAELLEKIPAVPIFNMERGAEYGQIQINWEKTKEWRRKIVSKLKKNLRFSLEKAGVEIFNGQGILADAHTVNIKINTNTITLKANFIILASGSEVLFPPGFEKNNPDILTNRQIIDIEQIPKTLLIIGGGAIGIEFASIFSAFGTQVTIAERSERLLPWADQDISAELERIFARKNIKMLRNITVAPEQTEDFEKTLIAIGRIPAVSSLGLNNAGINYTKKGIATDDCLKTNIQNIFAIGDLAGKAFLAYTAEREGEIAAKTILGQKTVPLRYEAIPNTIFSLPEVAVTGLTEEEVKNRNLQYIIGKGLMSANSKALIISSRDGFAKIIAEKNSHKILGIHIIGEKASELITEASLAITMDMTLESLALNVHSHPVLSEVLKEACESALYGL